MDDADIVARITQLAAEEQALEEAHAGDSMTSAERVKLRELEVALDQCWDLLRQRRARRNAGLDPDEAEVRPAEIVENYQQ
ncbi:MAG TPA: DUF2630 family protein [Acidimicrobiia bacterium]|nr:DUF2630 family protein [Acidimicrobiia bacterium]